MYKNNFYFTAIIFLVVIILNSSLLAQSKPQAKSPVEQAKTLYANGQFEQAQNRLLALLKDKNLPSEQKLQALILLAEIRRAMLDEDGARKIIDKILDLQPDFNPSERDYPPNFITLVRSEKQKRVVKANRIPQKHASFFNNKYFWIGIGGTAAATTAILLGTQKQSPKKRTLLPAPPQWPESVRWKTHRADETIRRLMSCNPVHSIEKTQNR